MPKPGLGQRLIDRIKALRAGFYIDREAKFGIKVTEFALDHRYPPGSVYKWVGDVVMPDHETILRLARDLDAAPGWLHYGEGEGIAPKAPRRQGRRTAGSLLIALMAGAAGMLGLPSPSVAAPPRSLPSVVQLRDFVAYTTRFRLARRLLMTTLRPA